MAEKGEKQDDPGLKRDDSTNPARKPRLNLFQVGLIIMLAVIMLSIFLSENQKEITLNQFMEHLDEKGHVHWVRAEEEKYVGTMTIPTDYKSPLAPAPVEPPAEGKKGNLKTAPFGLPLPRGKTFSFTVTKTRNTDTDREIYKKLLAQKIPTQPTVSSGLWSMLFWVFPFFLIIFLWIWMMRQSGLKDIDREK